MHAPSPPTPNVSPTGDRMLLIAWQDYPPMSRVAAPFLRLAGARLEIANHSKHDTPGGYGIVRQFVGHGIGTEMHQEPQVTNYRTGVRGMKLVPGICLAIEPMLTLGSHEVDVKPDGWTVVTHDGSLAAHFEHTIAVTDNGPEILTTIA